MKKIKRLKPGEVGLVLGGDGAATYYWQLEGKTNHTILRMSSLDDDCDWEMWTELGSAPEQDYIRCLDPEIYRMKHAINLGANLISYVKQLAQHRTKLNKG